MRIQSFSFAAPLSRSDLTRLRAAVREQGCFYAQHPLFPTERCAAVFEDAQTFFALPPAIKRSLAIANSPHFRGYSEMFNARDWREQIHFGREEAGCSQPSYNQLRGPNQWPPDSIWQARLLSLMRDLEQAGRDILAALAETLGLQPLNWLPADEEPYLLLKLIHYLVLPNGVPCSGVAPHVDFSWITLLIQDETGGLEAQVPTGDWIPVPPLPGTLVVNIGEVLAFATQGYYRATPHRVVNAKQSRISVPFFLNPALTRCIESMPLAGEPENRSTDSLHVHRIFPRLPHTPFIFGEAEWRRKGQGVWCADCVPTA